MKCDAMREWFSDRIDGALDPDRSASLDQHLARCAPCLADFESLRLVVGRLREAGPPLTSADERAAIMASIDREAEDRLVAAAVSGDPIERRSGVFKRAILIPQAEPAPRRTLTLVTHVASFGVGIAAAALFWFGGARDAEPTSPTTTQSPPSMRSTAAVNDVVVSSSAQAPTNVSPAPGPIVTPPPEMLLRVSGDLTVLRNGQRDTDTASPLTLRPGDVFEAESAGKWRIIVGDHGALELQSESVAPEPRVPSVSRGPMIAIDLDPAPLQRLAARMRSSIERLAVAVDHASERMPKTPTTTDAPGPELAPAPVSSAPESPRDPSPEVVASSTPADATPVAPEQPATRSDAARTFKPRAPVVVRHDDSGLRLETAGSPLEVVPALIQRLRDEDDQVVALVIARLELVREEFERDPKFPRVTPRIQAAAADATLLGFVASLVATTPNASVVEDAYGYWNRWFDTCADAIVARETYGTW